jgi:predicted metal-dependent HD superfamily phosphohydrolase
MDAMSDAESRLLPSWDAVVPGRRDLAAGLVARYADPRRHYHNLGHLQAVLDAVAALSAEAAEPRVVTIAAWYHDAVYDVRRDDNEERSALLAEQTLSEAGLAPAAVAEVARLVRLTAAHNPADRDANGAVLCDADLRVLASTDEAYLSYVAAVRAEYGHLSDEQFRSGRSTVLEPLLALPTLYRTAHGQSAWEAAARRNLTGELEALRR